MYNVEDDLPTDAAARLVELSYAADGMIWSSPMYQGTVSGAFKNAIDWMHLLIDREPTFLHDKVIGLVSVAGGIQGLQTINTLEFSARSLRAWTVPYVVPIGSSWQAFDEAGNIQDVAVSTQLATLGAEVVRVAEKFAADKSLHRGAACAEAADRVAMAI